VTAAARYALSKRHAIQRLRRENPPHAIATPRGSGAVAIPSAAAELGATWIGSGMTPAAT
jgi:hypothetical protein